MLSGYTRVVLGASNWVSVPEHESAYLPSHNLHFGDLTTSVSHSRAQDYNMVKPWSFWV